MTHIRGHGAGRWFGAAVAELGPVGTGWCSAPHESLDLACQAKAFDGRKG